MMLRRLLRKLRVRKVPTKALAAEMLAPNKPSSATLNCAS